MHTKKQRPTQNPHNQWEVHLTIIEQQLNHSLRRDSSISYQGLNSFYWHNISILGSVVLIHKPCLARMEASLLMQCIFTEKQPNQIDTLEFNKEKVS